MKIDRYGSKSRLDVFSSGHANAGQPRAYIPLDELPVSIMPAEFPVGLHLYFGENGAICSVAFVTAYYKFNTLSAVVKRLQEPGINYVLYIEFRDGKYVLRTANLKPGTVECDRAFKPPMPMSWWLAQWERHMTPPDDLTAFPHKCPKCAAPAYIGLNRVDCSRGCQ